MDKDVLILNELKRRIWLEFEGAEIYEGDGGVWGKWERFPCFHIFLYNTEDSHSDLRRPGKYMVKQKFQLEYVFRTGNRRIIYQQGSEMKYKFREAIELDERLAQDYGQQDAGDDLVIDYHRTQSEIVEVSAGIIDVAQVYEMTYTEDHFGYRNTFINRHT